ncbi:Competence protein ComM, partial [Dysosmobacter welbionis]
DQVAGPGRLPQSRRRLVQGGTVHSAGDIAAQVRRGDAQGVLLPGGEDLRQDGHVRDFQLFHEPLEQLGGARVGVGLEGHHQPFIPHFLGGGEQGVELVGVMGVVIVDLRPMIGTLVLESAAGAGEGGQARLHRMARQAQCPGRRGCRQGVENIVVAVDVELYAGVFLAADHHVEYRPAVHLRQIGGGAVGGMVQAEGEDGMLQPGHRLHGAGVVRVDDDGPRRGHQLRKPAEGVLDVGQILEEVQVVLLHVQNHCHGGEEAEEAVAVLTGLQDDGVPLAHPVAGVEQGQGAADHHRGIRLRRHEDVGAHGGGGGFAVGTGHAQRVGIPLHDGTPGLGPLVHGDTPGHGTGDLRVAVVDGSGADHQIAVPQVFGVVADGHGDAQGPEVADRVALRHVGALDMEAHAPQHLRQGAHGHAADAHQMGPLAGDDIVADGMEIVHHEKTPYLKRTASAPLMILWEYHEVAQKPAIPYQIFHYSMRRRKMQPEKSRAPFQDQRWRPQFRRLH